MHTSAIPNHAGEIRDFIIANFLFGEAGSLQNDSSFIGDGVIDSTGILELVMFLENTYGVKVQPEEMLPENFDSVNRVAVFLSLKLSGVADVEH
jgi:acyl carrier protein